MSKNMLCFCLEANSAKLCDLVRKFLQNHKLDLMWTILLCSSWSLRLSGHAIRVESHQHRNEWRRRKRIEYTVHGKRYTSWESTFKCILWGYCYITKINNRKSNKSHISQWIEFGTVRSLFSFPAHCIGIECRDACGWCWYYSSTF